MRSIRTLGPRPSPFLRINASLLWRLTRFRLPLETTSAELRKAYYRRLRAFCFASFLLPTEGGVLSLRFCSLRAHTLKCEACIIAQRQQQEVTAKALRKRTRWQALSVLST